MSQHELEQHPAPELPDPLAPAVLPGPHPPPLSQPMPTAGPRLRPHRTWQQALGGLIIAAACVAAVVWYVPRVLRTNNRLLSGSVLSSGVATLNFPSSGEIARIEVHQGERVRKGQLLATEYAPDIGALLAADIVAIRSEQSRLASMTSSARSPNATQHGQVAPTPAEMAAVHAQLKLDEAQLTADRARGNASRIVAPAAGTIVAANGRPGETVTSQGIRDYVTDGPRAPVNQTPAFSLLPEGPQPNRRAPTGASALPVIALRTSSAWQVVALVPQDSVSTIQASEPVSITVPAAHIAAIPGRISQVLPDPVSTVQGEEYQALVTVAGHVDTPPLSGMAADVQLAPVRTGPGGS